MQLGHRHANQFPLLEFSLNGQPGYQRHTVAHRHEALDRLQAGQFDAHVQRGLVMLKGLDYLSPQRGGHIMRDKVLRSEIANRHSLLPRQGVPRIYDEGQLIGIDRDGAKAPDRGVETR